LLCIFGSSNFYMKVYTSILLLSLLCVLEALLWLVNQLSLSFFQYIFQLAAIVI
jgi:hypothetical protein